MSLASHENEGMMICPAVTELTRSCFLSKATRIHVPLFDTSIHNT